MSGAAPRNLDGMQRRKSERLKDIRVIYSEDSETDFCHFKRIKTEIIDPEEAAFPSTSETDVASDADNDVEQDVHNLSLKALRARYKAKNLKTQKIVSEGPGTMNQTQSGNLENKKPNEEVDLDEPLISLKQKRQKKSPSKAKKKLEAPTSPHSAKVEDTISKRDRSSPVQTSSLDKTLHYSRVVKLGRRSADLEHSEIENAIGESRVVSTKEYKFSCYNFLVSSHRIN